MKYILTGSRAIVYYGDGNYEDVANLIENHEADIFEISSLDGIYELIEQLKGWDDLMVITSLERNKILHFCDK
jgi:hypothetical protein